MNINLCEIVISNKLRSEFLNSLVKIQVLMEINHDKSLLIFFFNFKNLIR